MIGRIFTVIVSLIVILTAIPVGCVMLVDRKFASDRRELYVKAVRAMHPQESLDIRKRTFTDHPFQNCFSLDVTDARNSRRWSEHVLVTLDMEANVVESTKVFPSLAECEAHINRG